ncbi:MAG: hypothetical protein ACO3CI_03625 [Schleiferiaceae bacterium]
MNIKETATLGVASMMIWGCGKYEDGPAVSLASKNNRLCREWELDMYDGQPYTDGDLYFEFEKDGAFTATSSYTYGSQTYQYTFNGTWQWTEGKESVIIDLQGDMLDFQLTRLTSSELWGDLDGDMVEFVATK